MGDTQSDLERRHWDLRAFCSLAFDAAGSAACLELAVSEAEAALASGHSAQLLAAYRLLAGVPSNIATVADVLQETSKGGEAEDYVRATELPLHRLRVVFQEVQRALSQVSEAAAAGLEEDAAFSTWRQQGLHSPGAEALRWQALGKTFGFDALADVHRKLCREQLNGNVEVGGELVAVGIDTWRAQLGAADGAVRSAVWDFVGTRAQVASSTLGRIKLARLRHVAESARLRGHGGPLDAAFAGFRLPSGCAAVLRRLASRVRGLADGYYRLKGKRLGLEPLRPCDLTAPLPSESPPKLGFSKLLDVLQGELKQRAPQYTDLLSELVAGETLLTDPKATQSPAWVVYADTSGSLPLVHVPYHRNLECYAAAAHELGHACHLTHLARARGAVAQSDDSLVFSETFAVYFEIVLLNGSLARATTPAERRYWQAAILEQALHFLRTLPLWAYFEDGVYAGQSPQIAWREAHRQLTPHWLDDSEADAKWTLQLHTEQMPFYGYGYQAAFLIAMTLFLRCDAPRLARIADAFPWRPLADVLRENLDVDLATDVWVEPILARFETMLADTCE